MLKRILPSLCLAFVLIGGSAFGVYAYLKWDANARSKAWDLIYKNASELLEQGQATQALELLNSNFNPKQGGSAQQKWPALMVQAAIESHAYLQLESLVAKYPAVLLENESAALWWIRAQMHLNAPELAAKLKEQWPVERRQQAMRWRLLRADELMRAGEAERALDELRAWQGQGNDEVNRQLRIALLSETDNSAIISALQAAYTAAPRSPEVRAISGEFLEQMGRIPQARRSYIAAFLLDAKNPLYGHLLAQFYLRTAALPQAIQTWRDSYEASGDQRAWWQVWFWERVTRPRGEPLKAEVAEWWGGMTQMLEETPAEAFLSADFLEKNLRSPAILSNSEAYYWLWSLELIRTQNEAAALSVLREMPQGNFEIAAEMKACLLALLEWRVEGAWPRGVIFNDNPRVHRWLRFLQNYRPTMPPNSEEPLGRMEAFLASDYAISSILLANGWLAAADRILPGSVPNALYAEIPSLNWLPYADTKAQAVLHGSAAGLARSRAYSDEPAVKGLRGELLLVDGQSAAGIEELTQVIETVGPVGYRAAYLVSMAALEQKDWSRLEHIFSQRKDLANSTSGKELLARAALAKGEIADAQRIYDSLGTDSVEGCVFRYRTAIEREDYDAARAVLGILLDLAPNEPIFREWLKELNTRDG
ncbi:hypothetical protein QEH52_05400 [Coraliomargarita sp. SDUM461003]|uniref:Tetratricopeptide repeat protein n=1 Tax=Thalassobacterium maritimum TaxID=3041265 RepID=A0ABU1AUL4_9BACT|nr:hypothetical protein [Coraliomargarita sp. SDUM461003]MDQ8206934.1 hypothetical protein [Coraliomargarita sp. SDUM461003]